MRKWRGNEERLRKWKDSLSTFSLFSCLPMHFQCPKLSNFVALLSPMSQKTEQHTRYEKIILGQIRCEKAPQYVPGC